MGAFWGLPDFGAPQPTTSFEIYASYEPGPYQLWPTRLRVAELAPGRPDFSLTLVRSSGAGASYGALSLRIEREQDVDGALSFLRGIDPRATVALAPFQSGFIRLMASPGLVDAPPDLLSPSPVGWGGVDATQWNLSLSSDAATLVKAGLASTLPVTARAELEVLGVAPRVPVSVAFDPAALMAGLVSSPGASRQIPETVLYDYFRDSPANLKSLSLDPVSTPDREAFAQAMAGRMRTRFGKAVPSPSEGPPYVELSAEIPTGTIRWNLAEPAAVLRSWAFTLDPFAAARALAKTSGLAAVVRELTTSPLPLGFFDVDVQAYLPAARTGLLDIGVVLSVPAHPPFQPQADSHTVQFAPPIDHAVVHIRTSPTATLAYTCTTFADVLEGTSPRRLQGAPSNNTTAALRFDAHDFPVDLVEIGADASLLAMASVTGELSYGAPGGTLASTRFALGSAQPRVSVALPRDADAAALAVEAAPLVSGGGSPLRLGPLPVSALHLTPASFEEYGQHTVAIDCTFGPGASGPYGVDLIAECQPDDPSNVTALFITADSPTATWTYVATSPFRAGYRWRTHGTTTWSPTAAPGAPLHLSPHATPAAPRAWDISGAHVYVAAGDPPGRVRYVPGDPTPQLDAQGRPTLMAVDTGATVILSIGTRLELTAAQKDDIEVALLQQLASVDRIDFQPAPFVVGPVTLSLADGAGNYEVLATTPSMGAPPYNASFSVQLSGDRRNRVLAAIGGTPQLLKVDYPVTLPPDVAATFSTAPATPVRTTDVASWFPGGAGSAHIQHAGT